MVDAVQCRWKLEQPPGQWDHGKIAGFLLSGLRVAAPRYQGAVDDFSSELRSQGIDLDDFTEDRFDYILSDRASFQARVVHFAVVKTFSWLQMHWSFHAKVVHFAVVKMYWMWVLGALGPLPPWGPKLFRIETSVLVGSCRLWRTTPSRWARMQVLRSVGLLACVLPAPASSATLRVQTRLQPLLRSMPATIASSLAATQSGLVDLFRASEDHIINFFGLHGPVPRRWWLLCQG